MSEPFVPRLGRRAPRGWILAAAGFLASLVLVAWGAPLAPHGRGASPAGTWRRGYEASDAQADAARETMRRAETIIRQAKRDEGVASDPQVGVDESGLVGEELTPLVTTLGSLEAKRTAVNPLWAAVLVRQLAQAGIVPGDLVAAGFSGSFPGLNLATVAAVHALGADLAAVSSVTASTWGANQPGFTWPEMEVRLVKAGAVPRASIAVTAGGDGDVASELEPEARAAALAIRDACARQLGVPALAPTSARDAIERRMAAYSRASNGRRVALYVNVGGTAASLGDSLAVLRLRSGFVPPRPFDRSEGRGVMARFAERGVPVLTLLNIRDLAARWGVPLG